jgi:Xaa-Pro aminopeptidase
MKRGLVTFDAGLDAAEPFTRRLNALQAKMVEEGVDVALIYGNVSRSSGMDYLTNFCLYWNEGVLVVPRDAAPVLIMKLSKRVQPWIKRTSVIDDIRSGPRLAHNIASYVLQRWLLADVSIGIVDEAWWPSLLLDELKSEMPSALYRGMPDTVRNLRLIPDAEEAALLRQAGRLLREALDAALQCGGDAMQVTEVAVRQARLRGFLDLDLRSRQISDGSEYVDAVGQYRYVWLRHCRPRGGKLARLANTLLDATLGKIKAGVSERDLARLVRESIAGTHRYTFSCINQPDIETWGEMRDESASERPLAVGEAVALVLTLFHGNEVIHAAETVLVGPDSVERLTA